jgi:hypothetical protein
LLITTACHAHAEAELRTEAVLHASIVSTVAPGAVRYTGRWTSTTGPDGVIDCSTAASDGNSSRRTFVLGGPGTLGAPVYFTIGTRGFSGPGVYRDDTLILDAVSASIARQFVQFARTPASDVELTLRDDGSGSMHFAGYRSPQNTTIAATITWTCTTETVAFPIER